MHTQLISSILLASVIFQLISIACIVLYKFVTIIIC